MKIQTRPCSAFVTLRVLVASLLCLTAGMLMLLVVAAAQQPADNTRATNSSRWFARVASTFGINSPAQRFVAGGSIKLDKNAPERSSVPPQTAPAPAYTGLPHDLTPVTAVRSGKLRDTRPIDPDTVEKFDHIEPKRPKPPTESAAPDGPMQTVAGAITSAPVPTGLNFDGVGEGLADFSPSSNPPDVNGNVGATQYFQWNNTSFAIFNKTTGALEYGPAAGNTLFQALGGICAQHNDGDPVVSYDVLAGRWVVSQFVVRGPAGSYSHQCFAVSTTSDATGEYYLYDFTTDPVNFVDYPHQGVWPDGYYMATHIFTAGPIEAPAQVPGLPLEARLYVFEREKMIDGLPARMQMVSFDQQFGLMVADLDGLTPPPAGEAQFVVGPGGRTAVGGLNNAMETSRVKVTWDPAPTIERIPGPIILQGLSTPPCLSGDTAEGRDCVPQPPPATPLDYVDNIGPQYMWRFTYRNLGTQAAPIERLVVSGASTGSTSTPAHGAVEWFEFEDAATPVTPPTQPTIRQTGTYDPDTSYRWLPSISMDKDGNIAMGYSKSSTTVKPGIYVTGRLATDPLNTMGAEVEMKAGEGVQLGGGNRWGDYSGMAVDPIDQCTFYYTNEYLKTNGAFNWSTRIASFKFPSCVSAANLYGVVTGIITSAETGAPISGVRVALSNDYAGASDANGVYTILVPAGTYTASAADADRNCASASPASAMVSPPGGGTVNQNFVMTGTSKLEANGVGIDDSLGTNNGIVNRGECVKLNLGVKNNGCAIASAISGKLTTTTPGVTVVQPDSGYSDQAIDQSGTNLTPYKISVSNSFGCGVDINLSLELTYAGGTKTVQYTVPTCGGGPDQQFGPYTLTTSDGTQNDRLGRNGFPSTCSGKAAPADIAQPGTRYFKTFGPYNNAASVPRCYTVTINAGLNGPGDIQSAAYNGAYNPANRQENYLGDTGISGLGTTVSQASYSFTVPAGANFVVVVNTATTATSGTTASSQFSGTVSGFIDNTPGPGDCATIPAVPDLTGAAVRLTHSAAGTFDAPMPLDGSGVEPRRGNGNYTLVLRFDRPVQSGSASVTSGNGTAGPATFSGNEMLVPLSGVTDQQRLTITATGVTAAGGGTLASAGIQVGFLIGDSNNDSAVNSGDVQQTRNRSGQATDGTNFRSDVNRDGTVNSGDAFIVRGQSGKALLP